MTYLKNELFSEVVEMIAVMGKSELSVTQFGTIEFETETPLGVEYYKGIGFKEATRKDFNDFYIEKKNELDNFIKEL